MAQIILRDYLQNTEDAISSGRIDEAMANCQHILSYFPEAIEAQRLLGEVHMAQGHLEEAQQTFDWILTNDPENVIAYCNRALISERMSDIDTALDCYQQAYELSRGNSHIRQQFNQLSAKAGQQEFMFSRAGLARLYMRGDLLTQAIQEWEAVLNASPDRLDARIGLLETYWRDGTNDKVKQLATQILEEIPTCLKALLLLAQVVSAYNLERAKELIQLAETLDPELIMAHDLFSDLQASQPNDPFLALLKKESIALPGSPDDKQLSSKAGTAVVANGSHSSVESTDRVNDWNKLEGWSELDMAHAPQRDSQSAQKAPVLASWADTSNIKDVNSWTAVDQASENQIESGLETWQAPQEIDDDFDPALLEQQPWFQADHAAEPESTSERERKGGNLSSVESINSMNTWTTTQGNDLPSPPAWLDMLTKKDRQPSGSIPILSTQSASVQEPPESSLFTQPPVEQAPAPSKPEEEAALFSASEDKDPELEWPEWLKSLGAETLESEPESRSAPVAPETQQPETFQSWEDQLEQTLAEPGEPQLATLEHLENDLRSQGFVPLQPGTLSTLAQQPTLSSALAELSTLKAQPATPEPSILTAQPVIPEKSAASVAPSPPPSVPSEQTQPESWWADTLNQLATGSAVEQPISPAPTQVPDQVPVNPPTDVPQEPPPLPGYRAEALLENELETTMRRPAIRLQPVQHSAHLDVPPLLNRGRGDKVQEGNLSNKERLLRGYQFQLAGAYDDAMQEYRIIIRNAPEFLDEIISNVRALLKLAPKYSAGFRVLGDAYMRRGEYLHAMEAYNKALTIAKKAKSQSH